MAGAYIAVFLMLSLVLPSLVNRYKEPAITRDGGAGRTTAAEEVPLKRLNLVVEGMSCPTCPATIRSLLSGKRGVKDVRITYPSGRGYVLFDPTEITKEKLIGVLEQAGYKAKIIGTKQKEEL